MYIIFNINLPRQQSIEFVDHFLRHWKYVFVFLWFGGKAGWEQYFPHSSREPASQVCCSGLYKVKAVTSVPS